MIDKDLIVFKKGVIAYRSIPRIAVCGVEVGNIKIFRKHWTKSDHKHLSGHIHKIFEMEFHHINYIKNIVEMTLFPKYEVFY